MSIRPPLGHDTILLRPWTAVVEARGNTKYYEYSDGATVRHCNFQPFLMTEKFQEEFTIERESSRTFYRVFAPVTPETLLIDEKYHIVFEGVEYEVHAVPGEWRYFSGRKNHIAFLCKLRR